MGWLGCSKVEEGFILQGGQDLAVGPRASLRDCFEACADLPECTAFAFIPNQKKCFVKGGKEWKRAKLVGAQSVVIEPCFSPSTSGPPEPPIFRCGEAVADVLFVGGDLGGRVETDSIEVCADACEAQAGCSAYSFVAAKTACYLKTVSGWRSRPWLGALSAITCPKPFPGTGGEAQPPSPPRPPSPPLPPASVAASSLAPWQQDVVPNDRRPGRVGAQSLGDPSFFPLILPTCSYGQDLNFVGRFVGASQCLSKNWLITTLNTTASPADLYNQQRFDRIVAPPVPPGATRPAAADVATACGDTLGEGGFDGLAYPAQCWSLVYDHCIPGLTSRNLIPRNVLTYEQDVLSSLYAAAFRSGSFGEPASMPGAYTRVCLANATLAGTPGGPCEQLSPTDYLVHTRGFAPPTYSQCDVQPEAVSYVEAHVEGAEHTWTVFGDAPN